MRLVLHLFQEVGGRGEGGGGHLFGQLRDDVIGSGHSGRVRVEVWVRYRGVRYRGGWEVWVRDCGVRHCGVRYRVAVSDSLARSNSADRAR